MELIEFGNSAGIQWSRSIQQTCEDDCLINCHLCVQPEAVLAPYSVGQSTEDNSSFCDVGTDVGVRCRPTGVAELVYSSQHSHMH